MSTIEEGNGHNISARVIKVDVFERREYTRDTDNESISADGKVERPRTLDRERARVGALGAAAGN